MEFLGRSPLARARKSSFTTGDLPAASGSEASGKEAAASEGEGAQSRPANPERRGGRGHQLHKSWPTAIAETKGSLESGPTASSGGFPQKSQSVPSNGTSPGDESDGNSPSFEQSIDDMTPEISTPTGPFRHMGLSKAAQTHRLRKLRTPSKCRECNSYVYFQGAECEECYLACHKKCLETLAIQCGHKKLQGKLQLFGRDFAQQSRLSSDGVPFIVKKCICEIERRAMKTKGIYRVNGVKTRVEKLCQAFENGKELVELSQAYPHDISNVLKLYLRQLPEPIMPFRMYNSLMGLAKESVQGGAEGRPGKSIAELVDRGPETEKAVVALVTKLRDLLKELPPENLSTLKYIVLHLRRIVEVEQENKMTPGNLGIVFGPTLMRPRPTEATVSLSSLVDYPHQARIVEALVTFYPAIFETGSALPENPEDAVREDADVAENQEDACQPSDDTDLYLTASAEQAEAAFHEDLYREDSTRFIDSDSDPEDSAEAGIEGPPRRGSETSGDEETPSADEASEEGTLSRTYSVGQSDSEDVSPLQRCPAREEGRCNVDEDAVFGREGDGESAEGQAGRPLEGCNTNQSNNVAFPQPPFGYKALE